MDLCPVSSEVEWQEVKNPLKGEWEVIKVTVDSGAGATAGDCGNDPNHCLRVALLMRTEKVDQQPCC